MLGQAFGKYIREDGNRRETYWLVTAFNRCQVRLRLTLIRHQRVWLLSLPTSSPAAAANDVVKITFRYRSFVVGLYYSPRARCALRDAESGFLRGRVCLVSRRTQTIQLSPDVRLAVCLSDLCRWSFVHAALAMLVCLKELPAAAAGNRVELLWCFSYFLASAHCTDNCDNDSSWDDRQVGYIYVQAAVILACHVYFNHCTKSNRLLNKQATQGTTNLFRHCGVQWIWLDVGRNTHGHRGLDWISQLVDWVGLDLAKWTNVQLWSDHIGPHRNHQ